MTRPSARLAALAVLALALLACGKKGPPIAPELRLPRAPSGLQGSVDEDAIVVRWMNPGARFDGTPLRDLTTVSLYRREESGAGPPKPAMASSGRIVGYEEVATIRLDAPAPATVEGNAVQWVDRRGLSPGHRYVYVVTATDASGRSSPPSERRVITLVAAPAPPRNVQAVAGNATVTLRWDPPAGLSDGGPLSGEIRYLVLRGTTSAGPLTPLTPQPVAATSYTDSGLDNDTEYRYAVRAVRVDAGETATGTPSTALAVTPAVTTPPAPPESLAAVPSPGAANLAWRASGAANVARYTVYRAEAGGAFVPIGTTPPARTTFTDREVQPGRTYRYTVTASDDARRPNESARSNEITVSIPR